MMKTGIKFNKGKSLNFLRTLFIFIPVVNFLSLSNIPPDYSEEESLFQKVTAYRQYSYSLPEIIDSDNSAIYYSGKIDFSNRKAPCYSHGGVTVKAIFEGTGIDIIVEDSGRNDYLLVFIDANKPLLLRLKKGKHSYTIARDLSEGTHVIEVFKRSEAILGNVIFWGFRLEEGKGLVDFPPEWKTKKKMLFIGDSITAGYGNDRAPDNPQRSLFDPLYENHYNAYGAIAGRSLDSEYQAISYSGIGMVCGSSGDRDYNMPDLYRRICFGSETEWEAQDYIPDVIVINLGTNDYASEIKGKDLDDNLFRRRYSNFVKELRRDYPEAQIICAVGCMISDYWPPGRRAKSRLKGELKKMIQEFKKDGDSNIHFLELKVSQASTGDNHHPHTANHIEMAKAVEAFCRKKFNW